MQDLKQNNPCYLCKERTWDCHGSCEKYKAWKKEWDDAKKKAKNMNMFKTWY